jgi:hypothetical protein
MAQPVGTLLGRPGAQPALQTRCESDVRHQVAPWQHRFTSQHPRARAQRRCRQQSGAAGAPLHPAWPDAADQPPLSASQWLEQLRSSQPAAELPDDGFNIEVDVQGRAQHMGK